MKYPIELVLPFLLLFILVLMYIIQKVFRCTCFIKVNENSLGSHHGLILDENQSFNNANRRHFAYLDTCCCVCTLTNREPTSRIIYVPQADKMEYGGLISCDDSNKTSKQIMNDACPICFDTFENQHKVALLECGHGFHSTCIAKWLGVCTEKRTATCPLCKNRIDTEIIYSEEQRILPERYYQYGHFNNSGEVSIF